MTIIIHLRIFAFLVASFIQLIDDGARERIVLPAFFELRFFVVLDRGVIAWRWWYADRDQALFISLLSHQLFKLFLGGDEIVPLSSLSRYEEQEVVGFLVKLKLSSEIFTNFVQIAPCEEKDLVVAVALGLQFVGGG